jgi:hypothetical protein
MNGRNSFIGAVVAGALSGAAIGLLAFFFLTTQEHKGMGSVMFLMVPIVAGFTIALVTRGRNTTAAAGLLAVLACLALLIALGKEGSLCAVLAFPIIVAGLAIGTGRAFLIRRIVLGGSDRHTTTTGALLLLGPILVFTGERLERPTFQHARIEVVSNTVTVNDTPEHVWFNIQSIDNIRAAKPLLMYVGLPVPQRCSMRGQGVGARRTCYFNVGYIEEIVTAWDPPFRMELVIDRTHMPGRHWLGFEKAEYLLERQGDMTVLTRTTTVTSYLHPAWYWRTFERLGVESEHRYILQGVVLRAGQ